MSTELRIKLNEWLTDALYSLSERTGMDYTNITRMALMEYLEKRLRPADYELLTHFARQDVINAIFEWEHYNRIIKKYPEKKSNLFKKLFIVSLQNYKKLGHTIFDDYKTDISRFKEIIWDFPGVIDLLDFMIHLNESPLPDMDEYEHLLKEKKETEYYNKKWFEIYGNLQKKIGLQKQENYARLVELKIDHHLHTDTDAMYFLFDLLKNNKSLPESSGQETKRLKYASSSVDEGLLEELIKKYGKDFTFVDTDEIQEIGKKYATLAHIDYMIEDYQGTIDAEKNYMDKSWPNFCRDEIKIWQQMRKDFMERYKKNGKKK